MTNVLTTEELCKHSSIIQMGHTNISLVQKQAWNVLTRNAWMFLYMFIAIQAAWVLRPFIGWPDAPVRFFRAEAWDNAYVRIFRSILRVAGAS